MSQSTPASETAADVTKFPSWNRMENVDDMSTSELDELPFGAIRLDPEGKILAYNSTEAEISGRDPEAMIGRDFFREVAPCTNVKEFAGRFREGVKEGNLNAIFPYLFDFKMKPTRVWVRLFYSERTKTTWVFVTRQEDANEN